MAYTVDVLAKQQALALRLFGTITIDDRAEGLIASLSKLQATGFKRILVDLRNGAMQHTPIESCNRHAANLVSTFSHLPDVRVAYIYEPFHHPTPVEMLAAARGFYFETFTHIDTAMRWLSGKAPEHFRVNGRDSAAD